MIVKRYLFIFIFGVIFILYINPAEGGFQECMFCHSGPPFGAPVINASSLSVGIHGNLNDAPLKGIQYTCYACHGDGTPPGAHPVDLSIVKSCETCHRKENTLFNAPRVVNHRIAGENIQVAVDCITCHSNSIDTGQSYTNPDEGISHYGTANFLMTPQNRSSDCIFCHYDMNGSATWGSPVDPRNSVSFNHSGFDDNNRCYGCHVSTGKQPAGFHDSTLVRGGGRDCVACHDLGGAAPPGKQVDVSLMNTSAAVHVNLNSGTGTSLNKDNLRCFACHGDGDGSESAQPEGGHPASYKNPKNCNNNDCHSLAQSIYREPMIYSHFRNASLNGNQNNVTNTNVTAGAECTACHINSITAKRNEKQTSQVSHYGSTADLLDSLNCVFCHMDKDNSKDWGTATEINKNRTSRIEINRRQIDRGRNKITVRAGETVYLGNGYSLKLIEVTDERNSALIELIEDGRVVDRSLVKAGDQYIFEKEMIIDNATRKVPSVILNISSIFKGETQGFLQFEGSRLKKKHAGYKNPACYACHFNRFAPRKEKYLVIDREIKEDRRNDVIYYQKVFIDFKSDVSKAYSEDENELLDTLNNQTVDSRFLPSKSRKIKLNENEPWEIAPGYSITVVGINKDSDEAWLSLSINGTKVIEDTASNGEVFQYTPGIRYLGYTERNVTVFRANITGIFQGSPDFVLLDDVFAASAEINKIKAEGMIFGYNASWFYPDSKFSSGRIPPDFHAPGLFDGTDGGADCVKCHDTSAGLRIPDVNAISGRLGKHAKLNSDSKNIQSLTDPIDKACWACHGNSSGFDGHPPDYLSPRDCKSCHTYRSEPFYNATDISDELHGFVDNCVQCHASVTEGSKDNHTIMRFEVSPAVTSISVSPEKVEKGADVRVSASITAGYKMKLRKAEYFIDEINRSGTGIPLQAEDGNFSDQIEQVTGIVNTANVTPGAHTIFVHGLERNNRWGEFTVVQFTVTEKSTGFKGISVSVKNAADEGAGAGAGVGILVLILLFIVAFAAVKKSRRQK